MLLAACIFLLRSWLALERQLLLGSKSSTDLPSPVFDRLLFLSMCFFREFRGTIQLKGRLIGSEVVKCSIHAFLSLAIADVRFGHGTIFGETWFVRRWANEGVVKIRRLCLVGPLVGSVKLVLEHIHGSLGCSDCVSAFWVLKVVAIRCLEIFRGIVIAFQLAALLVKIENILSRILLTLAECGSIGTWQLWWVLKLQQFVWSLDTFLAGDALLLAVVFAHVILKVCLEELLCGKVSQFRTLIWNRREWCLDGLHLLNLLSATWVWWPRALLVFKGLGPTCWLSHYRLLVSIFLLAPFSSIFGVAILFEHGVSILIRSMRSRVTFHVVCLSLLVNFFLLRSLDTLANISSHEIRLVDTLTILDIKARKE